MDQDEPIAELLSRREIEDCIKRYCRGLDRMDVDLCKSAYHPDARDDHGDFIGLGHDLAQWAIHTHDAGLASWQHYVTNTLIDLDGNTAHGETYYLFVGRMKDSTTTIVGGGRYIDRFERREGHWAIAARICTAEWNTDHTLFEFLEPLQGHLAHDVTDPSYRRPLRVEREDAVVEFW